MRYTALPALVGSLLIAPIHVNAGNDTWFPIGVNDKRIAIAWVQLKSYKSLNKDSFRLNAKMSNDKGQQITGRIDVNCRNKDYYFRPNGVIAQRAPWAAIPAGSGIEYVGKIFCKRTMARSEWGYNDETQYLWDQDSPEGSASDAKGEWLIVTETDEVETYYNTDVINNGRYLLLATWFRAKKGERSAAQPGDTQGYLWVNVDCSKNLYSMFYKPDESIVGTWLAPVSGRPGGVAMLTKKRYCNV